MPGWLPPVSRRNGDRAKAATMNALNGVSDASRRLIWSWPLAISFSTDSADLASAWLAGLIGAVSMPHQCPAIVSCMPFPPVLRKPVYQVADAGKTMCTVSPLPLSAP
ncbi:hypothetical protein D3C72_2129150 [compost metagenome]